MSKIRIIRKHGCVKPQGYYVYLHRRATDGSVFYVGKGKSGRLISTHCRSSYWVNVAKKYGVTAHVALDGLTECCAFTLEKILIHRLRQSGVNIVNITSGGEGSSGYKMNDAQKLANRRRQKGLQSGAKNGMWGKSHTDEVKAFLSEIHTGRKSTPESRKKMSDGRSGELNHRYGIVPSDDTKRKISDRKRGKSCGRMHHNYDRTEYFFINKEGRVFRGTQYDFCKLYDLSRSNVCTMVNRGKGSVKGWSVSQEKKRP